MSLTIRYNLTLKRSEINKFQLPDLKASGLVLKSFELKSEQKGIDIKLKGKDTIVSYGEAIFYQTTSFDLSDKLMQIIEIDKVSVEIKNLCTAKESNNVVLTLLFNYTKMDTGIILFNNIYTQINPEVMTNILSDISKAGKHITKLVWTSPSKLSSLELVPQFETDPEWLKPIKCISNQQNHIIMDLSDEKFEPDFINLLCHYNIVVPENVDRLGLIVYGFPH